MELHSALHVEDLEKMLEDGCLNPQCTNPDCNEEIFLGAACHPQKGVHVIAKRGDTRVHVVCAVCEKLVGHIQVAYRNPSTTINE